jgi:hypothetical protein
MLALPLHSRTFGRVMISIWVRPASWLSAANELVRKRICRISSRAGRRPPRKPLTWNVARAAGHLLQRQGKLVRVVGERVDLVLLQRGGLGVATAIVGCRQVADHDFLLQAGDPQRDVLVVRATAQVDRGVVGSEPGKLDVQLYRAGSQPLHRHQTTFVGHHRNRLPRRWSDDHCRVGDPGAGFVHDHQPKLRLVGSLRPERHGRQTRRDDQEQQLPHLVNVFGFRFGLMR